MNFEEWLMNEKYQDSFNFQCYFYYNASYAYLVRKNLEFEDFKQQMYLRILKYWNTYNGEVQCDTYTDKVIKRATIREQEKWGNYLNKANTLDTNKSFDIDAPENKIQVPVFDEEKSLVNEAIEYIIEGVKEQDKDVCKLYLMGVSMKDIEKFTDFTWKQIRDRCKVKYNKIFKERFIEFYGLNIV